MKTYLAFSRWAFDGVDAAPMAALRIALGLLTLGWAISYFPDVDAFLADDGLVPRAPATEHAWVVDLQQPYVVLAVLCVVAVAVTVGWHTRIATVLALVLLIAIQRRDPYVLNSGDILLRNLAFYVALMPAGEVWSLDARRRSRPPALRAPWALRMLQVQVSIIYLAAVMAKLRGDTWNGGTAVGISLQLGDLQRFVVPDAFTHSLLASTLLTYGTLVMEGLLVFGLWVPRIRKQVAIAGIVMHLGIDLTLAVGWFSFALIACYLAFAPADSLRAFVAGVQQRWRGRGRTAPAGPVQPRARPVSLVKRGALGSQGPG